MTNSTEVEMQADSIVIGAIYVIFVLIEFLFYLPCMIVMKTDSELKQHSCYRMMFQLGIADFVNFCSQFCAGLSLITGAMYQIPQGLVQYPQCHKLVLLFGHLSRDGINRFVTICLPAHVSEKFFSPKATTLWICGCAVYAGCWLVFDLSPLGGWVFISQVFAFYFDATALKYDLNKRACWWQTFFNLNMAAMWYGCIVIYMCVKRHNMTSQQNSMQEKERKIMKQAGIICFYTLIWDQYFHLAPILFTDYNFKYAYAVANLFWISNSGINPLVYLTLNKTIRQKVRSMVVKTHNQNNTRVHPHLETRQAQSRPAPHRHQHQEVQPRNATTML